MKKLVHWVNQDAFEHWELVNSQWLERTDSEASEWIIQEQTYINIVCSDEDYQNRFCGMIRG